MGLVQKSRPKLLRLASSSKLAKVPCDVVSLKWWPWTSCGGLEASRPDCCSKTQYKVHHGKKALVILLTHDMTALSAPSLGGTDSKAGSMSLPRLLQLKASCQKRSVPMAARRLCGRCPLERRDVTMSWPGMAHLCHFKRPKARGGMLVGQIWA